MGAVGNGAAHLAYSRSISPWFDRRLGTALAFVMVGAGLGAMILPVVAQSVITRAGWRAAYASLGGFAMLLGLPLSWRYIRERGSGGRKTASVAHAGMSWQQGLRSFPFWIVTAILFVSSISMNGAITHLSPLLADRGLTTANAAFGPHVALAINAITALGILLLPRADGFLAGALAAALIGIGAGGEAAITPYLLTRYFGLRAFSTLYGFTWTFYAAAGAIGPVILGRTFDLTGSYALLTELASALGVIALSNFLLPCYSH